ncbi:hypothetical protein VCR1J2_20078 [Vibrio coralliirubri]|nr:hypothetical protein VCR1J2_20078 [Vibrio coralliirubri]
MDTKVKFLLYLWFLVKRQFSNPYNSELSNGELAPTFYSYFLLDPKTKRPRNARPLFFYLSEEISREVLRRISLRLKLR